MKRTRTLAALVFVALVVPACGGGGGGRNDSSDGIVGRLTGDPDDEVSRDLEVLVDKALQRTTAQDPIDD